MKLPITRYFDCMHRCWRKQQGATFECAGPCEALPPNTNPADEQKRLRARVDQVEKLCVERGDQLIKANNDVFLLRAENAVLQADARRLQEIHRLTWHMLDDSCHDVSANEVTIDLGISGEYYNALMEIIGDECPAAMTELPPQ